MKAQILCPSCKTEISVDDVLSSQIEARIQERYETEKRKDKELIEAKVQELSRKSEEVNLAKKDLDKRIADGVSREKEVLAKKEEELEKKKRDADLLISNSVKEKLAEREKEILQQAKRDAESEKQQEIEALKSRESDLSKKLTDARKEQVKLMDEKRKLADEKENFEVEKRKQLDEERFKIKVEADKRASESFQSILAQKDKTISDALRANEDLRRKMEQGSQQTQGEVAELNLEEELKASFVYDEIAPVSKGIRGADVVQAVRSRSGKDCGKIIWEVKNTKGWSEGWIQKLKNDQRSERADVAVIVSNALPDGITSFALRDGVWVCDMRLAIPLATIIRDKLEAITREKGLAIGKNEKMDILYSYLTGVQFRQRVEAIVEAFSSMKEDIEKEKRFFNKKWASQEMQISRILTNTAGFYGDIDGMISLPKIKTLELEYHSSEDDEPTEADNPTTSKRRGR